MTYFFECSMANTLITGQLSQQMNATDYSDYVRPMTVTGAYGPAIPCLNPMGFSGAAGTLVMLAYNQLQGLAGYKYQIVGVQQFATNIVTNVTWNSQTGSLLENFQLAALSGPGLTSNQTALASPTTIVVAQDAGNDIQRVATTCSTPTVTGTVTYANSITISSTVSHATGAANPTGYVTFFGQAGSSTWTLGQGAIGSGNTATLTITCDALTQDSGQIFAFYNGDSSYAQSTSSAGYAYTLLPQTPTVTLTCSEAATPGTNTTSITYGDTIFLYAYVSLPSAGNTAAPTSGTVTFYNGALVIGAATVTNNTIAPGNYAQIMVQACNAPNNINWGASQTWSAVFTPSDSNQLNTATGTLVISVARAYLTVSANSISTPYGTPAVLGYTVTGFVANEGIWLMTGAFYEITFGIAGSPVRTYPVLISSGTAAIPNYLFQFVAGTNTITQVPISVTALNVTVPRGTAPPSAYPTQISGVVNNDNIVASVINPQPNMSIPSVWVLQPTLSGTALGNYSAPTIIDGILTVT